MPRPMQINTRMSLRSSGLRLLRHVQIRNSIPSVLTEEAKAEGVVLFRSLSSMIGGLRYANLPALGFSFNKSDFTMPRQPFLPKYLKAGLVYGPGHIPKKPKIAEGIGRCIMTWSYVDWAMAILLAALMKANSEASVAIFLTLRNARAQRDVLIAAADMTLKQSDNEIFDAIMLIYGSLQSQRADIAHGIFGFIPEGEEDAIPWIETKNLSKDWVDRFHKPKPENSTEQSDDKLVQKRSTYIYKLSDLERLETEIMELWRIAFSFASYLNYPSLPLSTRTLEELCAFPQMVKALSQIRSCKSNPPSPQ